MAIKIVTAKKGEPHITSSDDGAMHQGIFGVDDYVLNVGEKFRAELVSNNEIKIYDGEGMMQGRHWRIEPGTYESVTIDNGSQGMKRKDLIVALYTKDSGSGVENIELAVLKGEETEENAIAPVPETGDIRNGDLQHEMILYIVTLDGLNVTAVDAGFSALLTAAEMQKNDYVIEEDISSPSTMYRKWASGLLECWMSQLYVSSVNIPWGALYRSDNKVGKDFPSSVKFLNPPITTMTVKTDVADTCWIAQKNGESTTRTPNFYFIRPDSFAATARFYVNSYSVGRWK